MLTQSEVTCGHGFTGLKSGSTNLGRFHFIKTSLQLALAGSAVGRTRLSQEVGCRGGKGDR